MASTDLLGALTGLRRNLPAQARLYVAGCSGEPIALAEAFRAAPDLAAGVTFLGIWIPGVNRTDWASLHPQARAETIFLSAELRPSFEAGRTGFRPLAYTQAWAWLATTPLDAAVVMVSPPDASGEVSLGLSADFSGAVLGRADIPALALINPAMPAPPASPKVPLSRFAHVGEAETPLVQLQPADLPPAFERIGAHIASLIDAGDTLQFGLGNVQQAVLAALTGHTDLRIHSGMVTDPVLALLETGVIPPERGSITTGVALGTEALYARAGRDPAFRFAPVAHTHALATLAAIPCFKAINSCLEVDLFGQANAEFIAGRQVSGTGGLVDFLRGAAASADGRAITALTSTARRGTLSRIVPRLAPDATSIARADMDTVVTEHGIAELKGGTLDERAHALIAIADPAFRDSLTAAWDEMRRAM